MKISTSAIAEVALPLNKPGDPKVIVTALIGTNEQRKLGYIKQWYFSRLIYAPADRKFFCFVCGVETKILAGNLEHKIPVCDQHAREF